MWTSFSCATFFILFTIVLFPVFIISSVFYSFSFEQTHWKPFREKYYIEIYSREVFPFFLFFVPFFFNLFSRGESTRDASPSESAQLEIRYSEQGETTTGRTDFSPVYWFRVDFRQLHFLPSTSPAVLQWQQTPPGLAIPSSSLTSPSKTPRPTTFFSFSPKERKERIPNTGHRFPVSSHFATITDWWRIRSGGGGGATSCANCLKCNQNL